MIRPREFPDRLPGTIAGLAGLVLATVVVFWPAVGRHERTFFACQDNVVQSYPWISKTVRAWRAGEPPLWDFETYAGTSFVGEWQTAPLYPPHIAFAVLGLPVSQRNLDAYVVLHFAVGALLLFAFLRQNRLEPAAAFAGALIGILGGTIGQKAGVQSNIFFGLVWIPGTLALGQRALDAGPWRSRALWCWASAGTLALSILAGHPLGAILSVLALAFVPARPGRGDRVALKERLGVVGLVGLLGGLLAAPQLLPAFEYMARSLRWVGAPDPIPALSRVPYSLYAAAEVLSPSDLVDLLRPKGDLKDGASLLVAGARRRGRAHGAAAGAAIVLGVGYETLARAHELTWAVGTAGTAAQRYVLGPATTFLGEHLAVGPHRYRVLNVRNDAIPPNFGDVFPAIRTTLGHRATMDWLLFGYLCRDWNPASENFDRLAARYAVSREEVPGLTLVLTDGPLRVYERPHALPIFQLEAPDGSIGPAPLTKAAWRQNSVEVELAPGAAGRLRMAQTSYPGWSATVDGRPRPLETADIFLALRLGPSDRVVRLKYAPISFRAGLAFAGVAVLGLALVLGRARPLPVPARAGLRRAGERDGPGR